MCAFAQVPSVPRWDFGRPICSPDIVPDRAPQPQSRPLGTGDSKFPPNLFTEVIPEKSEANLLE